jgi:UPF0271 protein
VKIDINCDMGESFGAYSLGRDAEVMPSITSANIACGFHAGDPGVMRRTIALARENAVAVGAHPGHPDLVGFGRREMQVAPAEVEDFVLYQIGALAAIAASEGMKLQHVKAHGALYNQAVRDPALADAIARATRAFDPSLVFFALPGSALEAAGHAAGLRVAREVFADRAYEPDGTLAARKKPGSVIHDADAVVARAVTMVRERHVVATNGETIPLEADTICVHGDTPGAEVLARALRRGLEEAGIEVRSLGRP